jgi:hypothetical protein
MVGWGAHLLPDFYVVSGVWSPIEAQLHANNQELLAVQRDIMAWREELRGQSVMIHSDSTTVCSYMRHQGGTKSRLLRRGEIDLLQNASALCISLQSRHIPGRLTVIADGLSRERLHTEWTLHPNVFAQILAEFPERSLDVLATRYNNQLPPLRVPVAGRQRGGSRWASIGLGRRGPLRFSPYHNYSQSSCQTATQSMQHDVSRTPAVESFVDHATTSGGNGNSEKVSSETRSAAPTRVPIPARRPKQPEPACLQVVRGILRRQGFSESIVTRFSAPVGPPL